jgi:lysozyme family protein
MTASSYKPSLALVLSHEGGYVNHRADPGGPTNKGITQKVYDAYRVYNGMLKQSVRNITSTEVSDIYNRQYWKLIRGDSLPTGLDYAVFDFAVNSGVSRAIKYLQHLVGTAPDGVIGLVTLAAVSNKARNNIEAMIAQYCADRLAFMQSLHTFATFGVGWTRRVMGYQPGIQREDSGVIDYATRMALDEATHAMPVPIGSLSNEVPGKAVGVLSTDTLVVAAEPPVQNKTDIIKAIADSNNQLAVTIEQN